MRVLELECLPSRSAPIQKVWVMSRFLVRVAIFLATAALGLLVAALVLENFQLTASGMITAIVVIAVAQSILTPFIFMMANRHASALLGGVGLLSTFFALMIASIVSDGLTISGALTWVLATLIVWVVTMFGAWLIPLVALKERDA